MTPKQNKHPMTCGIDTRHKQRIGFSMEEKHARNPWTAPEHSKALGLMRRGKDRNLILDPRPNCMLNPKQKISERLDAVRAAYNARLADERRSGP